MTIKYTCAISFFLLSLICTAQKKDVYLIFKSNRESECGAGKMEKERDVWKMNFQKTDHYVDGYFVICNQYFQLVPNSMVAHMGKDAIDSVNIMDIKQFLYEGYAMDKSERSRPYIVFNQIYILEEMEDGSYLKFKVKWVEKYID